MNSKLTDTTAQDLLKFGEGNRIKSRETHQIEFKQDFDWDDKRNRIKYLKSVAAFANRDGGYMIFGVSDSPRNLVGMTKSFNEIDDADISSFINEYLTPSPVFERREYEDRGQRVGIVYIHPSDKKPIVCAKTYDTLLIESSIYYRYSSKSDRIKSGDLIHLIKEEKELESQKWMALFTKISTIGVHNIGLYNSKDGKITTQKNNQFVLDEDLIKRLKVIDLYSENKEGAEAIKIIGEIDSSGTIITKSKYLHDNDIIKCFLDDAEVDQPGEYLKAMCYQTSGTLPVYYYLRSAGLSIEQGIRFLGEVNKNSQAKTKLINRLNSDTTIENAHNNCSINSGTSIGNTRLELHNKILNPEREEIDISSSEQSRRALEAIMNLNHGEYDTVMVKGVLKDILNKYYKNGKLSNPVRQAVAYIDLIENRP